MFFNKKKKYDKEAPTKELIFDVEEKTHLKEKTDSENCIWVEKRPFSMHSTTGSGGSYMHIYRQNRRWDRDQEWYRKKKEG